MTPQLDEILLNQRRAENKLQLYILNCSFSFVSQRRAAVLYFRENLKLYLICSRTIDMVTDRHSRKQERTLKSLLWTMDLNTCQVCTKIQSFCKTSFTLVKAYLLCALQALFSIVHVVSIYLYSVIVGVNRVIRCA